MEGRCANPFCGKPLTKNSRHLVIPLISYIIPEIKHEGKQMITPSARLSRNYICHSCFEMFRGLVEDDIREMQHKGLSEEGET